jgi:hypothetical protein
MTLSNCLHKLKRSLPAYFLVVICIFMAISVLKVRSAIELKTLLTTLKTVNLHTLPSPDQGLEYFPGSKAILEIASHLYGEEFNASDKNLSLILVPLPYDRLVPNAVNMQWSKYYSPPLSEFDFINADELYSTILKDDRPIGKFIKSSKNWVDSDRGNNSLIVGLNNIVLNNNLGDPLIVKGLKLDANTLALLKYRSEFFTKSYLNERILQQAYPDLMYRNLVEQADVVSWKALLSELNEATNEVTLLVKNTLLSKNYKLPSDVSDLSSSDRSSILSVINRLIHSDVLLINEKGSAPSFLSNEIKKAITKKWYGKNLLIVNRAIMQQAMGDALRPSNANLSLSFDYYPFYPSIPIRADLGDFTLLDKETFPGSIGVKGGIWFRPALKFFSKLPLNDGWKIPFSDDLATSKEILIIVNGSFSDKLNFDFLAPYSDVLTDESWLVSTTFNKNWNDRQFANNNSWHSSSVKGSYGVILMKFPALPTSNAKWISRNRDLPMSTDVYYRKVVDLRKATTGDLIISGINRYKLYINGVLVGQGEHWNLPGKYPVTLKDGDVIGVHISVDDALNDALLIDFHGINSNQWSQSPVTTGYTGNRIYLKKQFSDIEIQKSRLTGHIDLNELKEYQKSSREFFYYISPFTK